MEVMSCVQSVMQAAMQYRYNKSDDHLVYFQRQLELLTSMIENSGSSLKLFGSKQLVPTEMLTTIVSILDEPKTKCTLTQKCILLINNLAQDNEIRQSLHDSFHLTPCLVEVIRRHGRTPGDPLIPQTLDLLQKITYGHHLSCQESYITDLLTFILGKLEGQVNDLTQSCLGLLVSLCRGNLAIQTYLKNLTNIRSICKTLMSYLNDKNKTITIFSLSILTTLCLHDDLGEKLFSPKNIPRTFPLIFKVLLKGDSAVTKTYAVDLFKDLLMDPEIKQSLSVYEQLPYYIGQLLNLICSKSQDTVVKIFDLFLSLCNVGGIRFEVCKRLLLASPLNIRRFEDLVKLPVEQLGDPLIACVHWASQSVETHNITSHYALDFLFEVYEELVFSDTSCSSHSQFLLPLILQTLTLPLEGDTRIQRKKCAKVVKAIKLLTVLCNDEKMCEDIAEHVDALLLSQIVQFQFNNNQIILGSKEVTADPEDWSLTGTEIVLLALELMLKLKPTIPDMGQLFTETLQDSRSVNFLVMGLASENREHVQSAVSLFRAGCMLDEFPTVLLGDALATSNAKKQAPVEERPERIQALSINRVLVEKENVPSINQNTMVLGKLATSTVNMESDVQSLIQQVHTALDLNGMKSTDLMEMYEHKLQEFETKEGHLQDLLETKSLALTQADRLLKQLRSRKAQQDAEAHKMRTIIHDLEKKSDTYREELTECKTDKEKYQNDIDQLVQDNQRLEAVAADQQQLTAVNYELTEKLSNTERSLLSLRQEHKTLTEMHEMIQKHYESLKHQHDSITEQVSKLEDERKEAVKQRKDREAKLQESVKTLQKLNSDFQKTEKERDELEDAIDKLRTELQKTNQSKKELHHKLSSMELLCRKHETDIQQKDEQITKMKEEIAKHSQIVNLIHSISSGKSN
ncbi:hypothetical protein ScPMuIL_011889 [Solemya velum]